MIRVCDSICLPSLPIIDNNFEWLLSYKAAIYKYAYWKGCIQIDALSNIYK